MQIPAQLKEDDFISFSSPGAIYSHFNLLPFALLSLQQAVSPQTAGCLYSPCSTDFCKKKNPQRATTKKNLKAGVGGRERQQSAGGRSIAVLWHRFLEKMRGFGLLLGKRVRIGQGRCPLPPSEQWLEGTGPAVPGCPPHARMGATVLLDPAQAGTPCFPRTPSPATLGQWYNASGWESGSSSQPKHLENIFQRAGLAAPCHRLVPRCPVLSPAPWHPISQCSVGMEATVLQ